MSKLPKKEEEECVTWEPADETAPLLKSDAVAVNVDGTSKEAEDAAAAEEKSAERGRKGALILSLLTLVISIPAVVGAWCWPALLVAIVGGTVSGSARSLGHTISLGITAGMLGIVLIFTAWTARKRRGTRWQKWGPLILCGIATPLILAEPLRHVLVDNNYWTKNASEYRPGCNHETPECLSVTGWFFTFIFTIVGILLLIVGSFWNANVMKKLRELRDKWRKLRSPSGKKDTKENGKTINSNV